LHPSGKICIDGGSGPTVDVQHATRTMKMRTTFSNAPTNNAKIFAKRLQDVTTTPTEKQD
jgi:hypothetical protein